MATLQVVTLHKGGGTTPLVILTAGDPDCFSQGLKDSWHTPTPAKAITYWQQAQVEPTPEHRHKPPETSTHGDRQALTYPDQDTHLLAANQGQNPATNTR